MSENSHSGFQTVQMLLELPSIVVRKLGAKVVCLPAVTEIVTLGTTSTMKEGQAQTLRPKGFDYSLL